MDCPLYNEDDDAEHAPESVRTLRSTIEASDGVIMISPEYNRGMSSVLKNALAGIDDLFEAIRTARSVRAAA